MSKSLAIKYRPKTFSDVVEQDTIKSILINQLNTKTFKNCYLFTGGAGTGKAQPLDSLVLTPNGYTTIGKLNINDSIIGADGKSHIVTNIYDRGMRDVYELKFTDGSIVKCCNEHLWNVAINHSNDYKTITLQEIIDSTYNCDAYNVPLNKPVEFNELYTDKDRPINPYLYGAILSYEYTLKQDEDDVKIHLNVLKKDMPLIEIEDCETIDIDNAYIYTSIENRLNLLRGLIDVGGRVYQNSNGSYCTVVVKSFNMVKDLLFIIRSLGGYAYYTKTECNNNCLNHLNGYIYEITMFFNNKSIVPVSSIKHCIKYRTCTDIPRKSINEINYIGKEHCKCIMVDSDEHLYITDDFTVTHNTTDARIFANDLNGGKGTVIELDAASNNSVEDVRHIIEDAQYQSLTSEYKVYILDECFHKDTLVQTVCDCVKISKIKVGDVVANLNGYGTVTKIHKTKLPLDELAIVIINGKETLTTKNHLYCTSKGWKAVATLTTDDTVYNYKYVKDTNNVSYIPKNKIMDIINIIYINNHINDDIIINSIVTDVDDLYNQLTKFTLNSEYLEMLKNIIHSNITNYNKQINNDNSKYQYPYNDLLKTITSNNIEWNSIITSYINNISKYDLQRMLSLITCATNKFNITLQDVLCTYVLLYCYYKHMYSIILKLNNKYLSSYTIDSYLDWVLNINKLYSGGNGIDVYTDNFFYTYNNCAWQEFYIELLKLEPLNTTPIDEIILYNNDTKDRFKKYLTKTQINKNYTYMYDLSVDNHNSYFANDILVHNCHMLSTAAFNALLKILEEPPKKSIFILCTTDPQKIPNTILSRVQRYNFQRISQNGITNRLKYIIEQENIELEQGNKTLITYEEDAIVYISKLADGGMRDAITSLDKCLGYSNNLTLDNVVSALGTVPYDIMFNLTDAIINEDKAEIITIIENIHNKGLDLKQYIKQYNYFILDLCKYGLIGTFDYIQIPLSYKQRMDNYRDEDYDFFNTLLNHIIKLNANIKYESTPKPLVESSLLII